MCGSARQDRKWKNLSEEGFSPEMLHTHTYGSRKKHKILVGATFFNVLSCHLVVLVPGQTSCSRQSTSVLALLVNFAFVSKDRAEQLDFYAIWKSYNSLNTSVVWGAWVSFSATSGINKYVNRQSGNRQPCNKTNAAVFCRTYRSSQSFTHPLMCLRPSPHPDDGLLQ